MVFRCFSILPVVAKRLGSQRRLNARLGEAGTEISAGRASSDNQETHALLLLRDAAEACAGPARSAPTARRPALNRPDLVFQRIQET